VSHRVDRAILEIRDPADLQRVMHTDYAVSPQQWAAISAPLGPAVVIAGAGSGKTSLMAARVVQLVVTGQVTPDQVLGLTFTTKAAGELRTRIRDALDAAGFARGTLGTPADADDEEVLEPMVATYNAYAASLLTEHGLRIGHEPDTRVIADAARYQLAGRVIDRHTRPVRLLSDSPSHVIQWLLALDGAMAEHLVDVAGVRGFDAREATLFAAGLTGGDADKVADTFAKRGELLDLVEHYRRQKRDLGLMDFSDQIALAARLADEHPMVGALERDKYRIVLLDEYQDTSVAQALMLSRLFSGPDVETGRGHAVTAVGDPNQAIYGWRGASVSNILRFGEDFPTAGGDRDVPTHPLTVNRRSDTRILDLANRLAQPLLDGFRQVQPLEPGRDEPGVVQVAVHETYADELVWLAERVRETHDADPERGWREIGVLVRDNTHAADVFDALTSREIPVEIVGLKGLLRLPEVAEVLATLTLVHDLSANAELLALLTGPRWAVGPRDLALLGGRARELADARPVRGGPGTIDDELARAVAGADPTEVVSLTDALDDPGDLPYSEAGRQRFARLSGELRGLRSHASESLLELVRRIIDTCGIDLELASSVSDAARARRENLDLFVKAVAEFQAVDGAVTLPALLAWLEAELDGEGLDVATPTPADSVKLLTVHRAKGLEWDSVFIVGACEGRFPHTTSRGIWPTRQEFLPTPLRGDERDLPALPGHDASAMKAFRERTKDHEAVEELRLGYVAFTRARHALAVSSYLWKEDRKTPLGPSPYQVLVRDLLREWGEEPLVWRDKPARGTSNPLSATVRETAWPVTEQTAEALRRLDAAERVLAHLDADLHADPHRRTAEPPEPDLVHASVVADWDETLDRLLTEARREQSPVVEVCLPASLSATALARLHYDPDTFAAELARPMPRQPAPSARLGTRFHEWVESRLGQPDLIDPDELPGRADAEIDDYADLRGLIEAFEQGPFGQRRPHRTEAPFALVLGGQVVRGRIDAVYREPDGSWLVVDWKTSRAETADPLQLAIYRVAWADLAGVEVERVRSAFSYVRSGRLVEPPDLPDRAALARLVSLGDAQER
jgi:DNA helicase II / ATP-dependent DNA helicase PcrA